MNLLIAKEIQQDLTSEPLILAEAKAAMKVNFTDDDAFITDLIKTARLWLENYTGRQLGTKVIKLVVDMTAHDWYELPGPVVGLVAVTMGCNCVDYKNYGDQLMVYYPGIHEILVSCGYTTVPEDYMTDLKRIVAWSYQNRGIDLSNEAATLTDFPELMTSYHKKLVI
jgi:hypothetical protein